MTPSQCFSTHHRCWGDTGTIQTPTDQGIVPSQPNCVCTPKALTHPESLGRYSYLGLEYLEQ